MAEIHVLLTHVVVIVMAISNPIFQFDLVTVKNMVGTDTSRPSRIIQY